MNLYEYYRSVAQNAETRFEDQISKLVLEKQELEWEKVCLQKACLNTFQSFFFSCIAFNFVFAYLLGKPSTSN